MLLVVLMIENRGLAVVSGNAGEQGADVASSTDNTNSNTTTTTAGETITATVMVLEAQRLSMEARIRLFFTLKTATATPRRPRFAFRQGIASMRRHARLSSAFIQERPTATTSDATLDENRVRSESNVAAWMRRAVRAVSVSVGVRRASQGAAKEGEAAMVAAGC